MNLRRGRSKGDVTKRSGIYAREENTMFGARWQENKQQITLEISEDFNRGIEIRYDEQSAS